MFNVRSRVEMRCVRRGGGEGGVGEGSENWKFLWILANLFVD